MESLDGMIVIQMWLLLAMESRGKVMMRSGAIGIVVQVRDIQRDFYRKWQ